MTTKTIKVKVHPKASWNEVVQVDENSFKVYTTTLPEDGKANKEVLKLLSKYLKIPKTSMEITRGSKSRDKEITCIILKEVP